MMRRTLALLFALALLGAVGCETDRHRQEREEFEHAQDCSRAASPDASQQQKAFYRDECGGG